MHLSVYLQVITHVCQMLLGPISLIFCGHLNDAIQLDGAALAISVSLNFLKYRIRIEI